MKNVVFISKRETKIMAWIMTLAIMLSCFVYTPKTAVAESTDVDAPSVSVLGATLRLTAATDNSDNGQAMRLGIQVNNASNVKACAIILTVGDKSYTVSTEAEGTQMSENITVDKQHIFLHSKDDKNDKVVYAVTLNGIPKTAFETPVKIKGVVKNMDNDYKYSDGNDSRTVRGVVDSLNKQYPNLGIIIGEDGILYKNNDTTDKLTADDLKNYNHDSNDLEWYELDLSETKLDKSSGTIIENNTVSIGNSNSYNYIYIPLPRAAYIGEKVVVQIKGEALEGFSGLRYWPSNTDTDAKDRRMSDVLSISQEDVGEDGFFDVSKEVSIRNADNISGIDKATAICIKGPNSSTGAKNAKITSVYVTYKSENYVYFMDAYSIEGTGSKSENITLPENFTGKLTVYFKLRVNNTKTRAFIQLCDLSGNQIAQVEFRGGTSGNYNIIADSGAASNNIVNLTETAYEADKWYDVRVSIDNEQKSYSIQIDDNQPISFNQFKQTKAEGLGRITFGLRGTVKLDADDICVYQN